MPRCPRPASLPSRAAVRVLARAPRALRDRPRTSDGGQPTRPDRPRSMSRGLALVAAVVASLADWVALDGNLLLADDPFGGLELGPDKRWRLPDAPGLGLTLRPT